MRMPVRDEVRPPLGVMMRDLLAQQEARLRARLSADPTGRVTRRGRANAIKERVPGYLRDSLRTHLIDLSRILADLIKMSALGPNLRRLVSLQQEVRT